jgi:hypothetical protein
MKRSDWVIMGLIAALVLALIFIRRMDAQEAEMAAPVKRVEVGDLRGGFLMCNYGTVCAQLDTLTAPNTADLQQQAIEAGYCRQAKSGEVVQIFPDAWRFDAPGIVDPERGVKVILADELAAQGKAAGWWVSWQAIEAKS